MENEGLEALKEIKDLFTCHDFDLLEKCSLIEKALKAKDNLVSMCENLAKLVCLKEKDYVELESEIIIKQPQRKYYVGFTKHRTFIAGNSGMTFQDNCGFCVKDLNSERIKRPFYEENTIVENLIVKENKTNKVIYVGNDYQEFLETIKDKGL